MKNCYYSYIIVIVIIDYCHLLRFMGRKIEKISEDTGIPEEKIFEMSLHRYLAKEEVTKFLLSINGCNRRVKGK